MGKRAAAKRRGDVHYTTKKPCPLNCYEGKLTIRYTNSGDCVLCRKRKAKQYKKDQTPEQRKEMKENSHLRRLQMIQIEDERVYIEQMAATEGEDHY